jgi:hypothetical protein
MDFFQTLRQRFYPSPARVPEATWLTRPSQGFVKGIVTVGGRRADGARVRVGRRETRTDGTGFYAMARLEPGDATAELLDASGKTVATRAVRIDAGRVAEAPLSAR